MVKSGKALGAVAGLSAAVVMFSGGCGAPNVSTSTQTTHNTVPSEASSPDATSTESPEPSISDSEGGAAEDSTFSDAEAVLIVCTSNETSVIPLPAPDGLYPAATFPDPTCRSGSTIGDAGSINEYFHAQQFSPDFTMMAHRVRTPEDESGETDVHVGWWDTAGVFTDITEMLTPATSDDDFEQEASVSHEDPFFDQTTGDFVFYDAVEGAYARVDPKNPSGGVTGWIKGHPYSRFGPDGKMSWCLSDWSGRSHFVASTNSDGKAWVSWPVDSHLSLATLNYGSDGNYIATVGPSACTNDDGTVKRLSPKTELLLRSPVTTAAGDVLFVGHKEDRWSLYRMLLKPNDKPQKEMDIVTDDKISDAWLIGKRPSS